MLKQIAITFGLFSASEGLLLLEWDLKSLSFVTNDYSWLLLIMPCPYSNPICMGPDKSLFLLFRCPTFLLLASVNYLLFVSFQVRFGGAFRVCFVVPGLVFRPGLVQGPGSGF
jgi:hypothetical protein